MAPQSFQLLMKTGPTPGKAYPLDNGELTIGRDVSNEIVVNDAEVSRNHARITIQGDSYVLEDLGSTNGTFVDGQRLTEPYILHHGQTISLGENVALGFETVQYDPDATMVSTPEPVAEPLPPPATPPPQVAYTPSPPPPEPVYAGRVPPGQPEPVAQERKVSPLLIGGCGCLVIILCIVLMVALYYIDTNYLWCDLFPFLPNCP